MNNDDALIGYTGFIGSSLLRQRHFASRYNSKNISAIKGKTFDTVACAAAPGVKWLANKEPDKDWATIQLLIDNLEQVRCKQFVLFSTIDVYGDALHVDEDSSIAPEALSPYGKHRWRLEEFAKSRFNTLIIRLPGVFGKGLKGNVIYDLLNKRYEFVNKDSLMQFYNLEFLWKDAAIANKHQIPIINFATEPVSILEITDSVFRLKYNHQTSRPPYKYDMRSKYANLWGKDTPYLYSKAETLQYLTAFVQGCSMAE